VLLSILSLFQKSFSLSFLLKAYGRHSTYLLSKQHSSLTNAACLHHLLRALIQNLKGTRRIDLVNESNRRLSATLNKRRL